MREILYDGAPELGYASHGQLTDFIINRDDFPEKAASEIAGKIIYGVVKSAVFNLIINPDEPVEKFSTIDENNKNLISLDYADKWVSKDDISAEKMDAIGSLGISALAGYIDQRRAYEQNCKSLLQRIDAIESVDIAA